MSNTSDFTDDKIIYVVCPKCRTVRKKINGKYNIIKRGYERNHDARFLCGVCGKWFNESTGESMKWLGRV
jgi:transposase-like protein